MKLWVFPMRLKKDRYKLFWIFEVNIGYISIKIHMNYKHLEEHRFKSCCYSTSQKYSVSTRDGFHLGILYLMLFPSPCYWMLSEVNDNDNKVLVCKSLWRMTELWHTYCSDTLPRSIHDYKILLWEQILEIKSTLVTTELISRRLSSSIRCYRGDCPFIYTVERMGYMSGNVINKTAAACQELKVQCRV